MSELHKRYIENIQTERYGRAHAGVLTLSIGGKAARLASGLLVVGRSSGSGSSTAILVCRPLWVSERMNRYSCLLPPDIWPRAASPSGVGIVRIKRDRHTPSGWVDNDLAVRRHRRFARLGRDTPKTSRRLCLRDGLTSRKARRRTFRRHCHVISPRERLGVGRPGRRCISMALIYSHDGGGGRKSWLDSDRFLSLPVRIESVFITPGKIVGSTSLDGRCVGHHGYWQRLQLTLRALDKGVDNHGCLGLWGCSHS